MERRAAARLALRALRGAVRLQRPRWQALVADFRARRCRGVVGRDARAVVRAWRRRAAAVRGATRALSHASRAVAGHRDRARLARWRARARARAAARAAARALERARADKALARWKAAFRESASWRAREDEAARFHARRVSRAVLFHLWVFAFGDQRAAAAAEERVRASGGKGALLGGAPF